MPRKTKDAPGRTTPKGGPQKRSGSTSGSGELRSGRYTPPVPAEYKTSSRFVPILMVTFLVLGVILILLNYLGALGKTSNVYLFIGLGLIICGFIASTRWR
jgi:hypothetical protein